MNRIVRILMERDHMSKAEATDIVNEVVEMVSQDLWAAEDILQSELGLEPDYIEDILDFLI